MRIHSQQNKRSRTFQANSSEIRRNLRAIKAGSQYEVYHEQRILFDSKYHSVHNIEDTIQHTSGCLFFCEEHNPPWGLSGGARVFLGHLKEDHSY